MVWKIILKSKLMKMKMTRGPKDAMQTMQKRAWAFQGNFKMMHRSQSHRLLIHKLFGMNSRLTHQGDKWRLSHHQQGPHHVEHKLLFRTIFVPVATHHQLHFQELKPSQSRRQLQPNRAVRRTTTAARFLPPAVYAKIGSNSPSTGWHMDDKSHIRACESPPAVQIWQEL